jgi:hypothetical protein
VFPVLVVLATLFVISPGPAAHAQNALVVAKGVRTGTAVVQMEGELYAPDGQLYQTFTSDLPRRHDLVVLTVPVAGTPIFLNTLAGKWCARIFLDDDLEPVAAEDVELRFTPGQ